MPPKADIPPASYKKVWAKCPNITSSPLSQCDKTPTRLAIVPLGTNNEDSIPISSAAMGSSSFIVGSSEKTSSPNFAWLIAFFIPSVGRVTVSLLRSIIDYLF